MRSRSWLFALPLLTVLSGGLGALSDGFEREPPAQAEPEVAPKTPPPPPPAANAADDGEALAALCTAGLPLC